MTWKRALLIVGAALLVWLRPWRRLLGSSAAISSAPASTGVTAADSPFPEVLPVEPLRSEREDGAATTAEPALAPEDAFAPAAGDEFPADLALEAAPSPAPAAANDLTPEAAFGAPPELISGEDLDAALDLVEEPEHTTDARAVAPTYAEQAGESVPHIDDEPRTSAATYAEQAGASIPGSVEEPGRVDELAAAAAYDEPEPDAELEPEILAIGEPEPVEMAEDDLIDVPSAQADKGDEAGEGERTVGAPAAKPDDLLVIEGIGPRVSTIVTGAGIRSFAELAAADVERLRAILTDAGVKTVDPSTWPEQARIAAEGRWDELRELQRSIKNGKKA